LTDESQKTNNLLIDPFTMVLKKLKKWSKTYHHFLINILKENLIVIEICQKLDAHARAHTHTHPKLGGFFDLKNVQKLGVKIGQSTLHTKHNLK
jgi:hypothetical protein